MRRHNATPHRTFARNDPKQGCKRVKQSGSDDYRRFDPAFTGTRSVLTLGAPGIDRDWIRRHRLGAGVVIVWYIAVPLLVMIGLASAWGSFGRLDTWASGWRPMSWSSIAASLRIGTRTPIRSTTSFLHPGRYRIALGPHDDVDHAPYRRQARGCRMIVTDRLKGAVLLPVGILLLIAAAIVARSTFDFLHHSRLATGVVVAEPYGPHHVPVRFRTATGRDVTYHQNGASTLHTVEVVVVRYDPRDPALDPHVDRFGAIWGTVILLGVMGSVFAGVGALVLRCVRGVERGP